MSHDELVERYGVDQCPACGSDDLHSALIGGEEGVSCCDCTWAVTYAYLREQANDG